MNLLKIAALVASTPPTRVTETGNRIWENAEGYYHRDDGPAIEYANGNKSWYKNGQLHRDDGPSLIEKERKIWHQNGERHRLDGPAAEYANGDKEWFVNGKQLFTNANIAKQELISLVQNEMMKSASHLLNDAAQNKPGSREVLLDWLLERKYIKPTGSKNDVYKALGEILDTYNEFKANGATQS